MDGLQEQADLYIRTPDRIFTADDAEWGIITGSRGHDVIYGGDGDDIIYGGQGSDLMYGGSGPDLFIGLGEDYDGSLDIIKDFSFADNDRLLFEGILETREDLDSLLATGSITISSQGDTLSLGISTDTGTTLNVDVNVRGGELEAYRSQYTEQNGSTEGLEQALLQIMLTGV